MSATRVCYAWLHRLKTQPSTPSGYFVSFTFSSFFFGFVAVVQRCWPPPAAFSFLPCAKVFGWGFVVGAHYVPTLSCFVILIKKQLLTLRGCFPKPHSCSTSLPNHDNELHPWHSAWANINTVYIVNKFMLPWQPDPLPSCHH